MTVFSHADFDNHETVSFIRDEKIGLKAIIAVHNTNLGPSLGGCRMWPYASDEEALRDVLRLSRGMTYKSAISRLPLGGGKSVIIGDPKTDKSEDLLEAFARGVERLNGAYITAEDVGISVPDVEVMARCTDHVSGTGKRLDHQGNEITGDPSPQTALGVFVGLKAAVRYQMQRSDLDGLTVGVQGLGAVGYRLAAYLQEAGARLVVCDIDEGRTARAADELGATVVSLDSFLDQDMDVYAPCALGGAINDDSLRRIKADVIAGAANNQLETAGHGTALMKAGKLYAPDYVINAGGVIDVGLSPKGTPFEEVINHIHGIDDMVTEIFERATREGLPTSVIADRMAEERFNKL